MSRTLTDLLKIIAIVFVVLIHTTSAEEHTFARQHQFFSIDFVGVILNQMGRFSVPLFVFLSGYGLAQSSHSRNRTFLATTDWTDFFSKRFSKIVLPYIVLTFIFLFFRGNSYTLADGTLSGFLIQNFGVYAKALLKGNADFHFYFFVIILELYVLYPLLYIASRKKAGSVLLALLFMNQFLWTYPSTEILMQWGIHKPVFPSTFFIFWIFYFYAGIWISSHPAVRRPKNKSFALFYILPALAFSGVMTEYVYSSYKMNDPGMYNHFHRMTIVLYLSSIILLVYWNSGSFVLPLKYSKNLSILSSVTFFVYIYHMVFVRLFSPFTNNFLVLFPLGVAAAFSAGWLISQIPRGEKIKALFGFP